MPLTMNMLQAVITLPLGFAGAAIAQPTISEMPVLPGPFTRSWATAVSADGRIVVGSSSYNAGSYDVVANPQATRWTGTTLQNLSGTRVGMAYATNQNGSVAVGLSGDGPFRWTNTGGFLLLPPAPEIGSFAWTRGLSRDGTVASGSSSGAQAVGFRWTASGGMQVLTTPGNFGGGHLSGNGQVLVGWYSNTESYAACRFVGAGPVQVVAPGAQAHGVSNDGLAILGAAAADAVRWDYPDIGSTAPPTVTVLGRIPGPFQELCPAYATAISDDGMTIIGTGTRYAEGSHSSQFPKSAFIWRPETGLLDLNEYLPARGLDLTGWHLRLGEDISADGRVIVGQGILNGLVRGFVIRLPEWCGTADFNGDTDFGTDADIEAFFACLAGQCCPSCWHLGADFNADGDAGTDADIEAFFRVLAGQAC